MCSIWEALIAASIDSSAFNSHMPPVATYPFSAEVTEMPGFVHISFHLLFCKAMLDDQTTMPKLTRRRCLPDESSQTKLH